MPSNMMAIDSNFPTFTGEEPVDQQIRELVNYLYQLRESLQYSLQNLGKDNFNISALDQMNEESQKQLVEQLTKMSNEMTNLKIEVDSLKGRISAIDSLSGRMTDVEADVAALQEWSAYQELTVEDLKSRAATTEQRIDGLTEQVETLDADVAELSSKIDVAEDGSATIGEVGTDLHLVGNIYINGILFEQGGST